MSDNSSIKTLFEPTGFAVIGASQKADKIGNIIVRNLVSGGFKGTIYPVNPSGGEIHGCKVYTSLDEIPGDIEGASISIPAAGVLDAVKACAARKIPFVQIIASGFSEVGNIADEQQIAAIARENNMRILGPNVFGLYSSAASMNATFSSLDITAGNVAILTQSGALGIALVGRAALEKMGLSAVVSTGNKCDIDESDLLEYLIQDDNTRSILIYLEGVKNGVRFVEVLKKAVEKKPVVVLKSGRTERGAMAAAAHTASLAGSDELFDAVMKQCGVLRAYTLEEAIAWSQFLAANAITERLKTVIITNGGGVGVLAADTSQDYGIDLADDQKDLRVTFEKAVPNYGSLKNPIDLTAVATTEDYMTAARAFVENPELDAAVFLYCQTAHFDIHNLEEMIRTIYREASEAGKPVTFSLLGGEEVDGTLRNLRSENMPVHAFVEDAVTSMGALAYYAQWKSRPEVIKETLTIDSDGIRNISRSVIGSGRNFMINSEIASVFRAAGINVVEGTTCRNLNQAVEAADEMGYPLVMKVVSRDIHRKSDVGGVALDLVDRNELIDAFEAISHNVKVARSDAVIDGVDLFPMITDTGLEIDIEAYRDQSFGPVVSCKLGGIFSHVNPGGAFRAFPLSREEVRSMLEEIGAYPFLLGVRWEMRKDIEALVDVIIKTGEILKSCEEIATISIDPVSVFEKGSGTRILDASITMNNPKEETL